MMKISSICKAVRRQNFIPILVDVDSIMKTVMITVIATMLDDSFSSISEVFHAMEDLVDMNS
jgi:hypothetical protein